MKKTLLLFFALVPVAGFTQIKYDTLSVKQIGDGVFHYIIEAPAVPWTIDVVEIDITNPDLKIETVKAQDTFGGYERTSSMSARKSFEGHQVIAAVNGDFYGGGNPTNAQVIKGEIIKGPINRAVFGYTREKKMFINSTSYEGKIYVGDTSYDITGINRTRGTDDLIYYNHYYSSSTKTDANGTELSLKALDDWVVNGNVRALVVGKQGEGSALLNDSTFVLSGNGISKTILDAVSIGDTLVIEHRLQPGFENIKAIVGGNGKFLNNGENQGNWPERHPRTGVGFNADSTKLYFMTVDGRQSTSAGMTLTEMGEFMSTFGVTDALNLDGGGSTTMVVHNKVENDPSDGSGEREVANALMLVSSTLKSGALEHLHLTPNNLKIYRNKSFTFTADGSDGNFYPVELDASKINFSVSEGFGASISSEGIFTAGNEPDTGFVYLEYDGRRDTSQVIIKGITEFSLFPEFAVTDSSQDFNFFNYSRDIDGKSQRVSNAEINWTVEDPSIGEVQNGLFKGLQNGKTSVIATFDGVSDTSVVEVQIGEGTEVIRSFNDISNWSVSGSNIDAGDITLSVTDSLATEGNEAIRLDYEFTYNNSPDVWVYLDTNIPVYGIPDSIVVDAVSDGKNHLIELGISDNNEESYNVRVKKWFSNTSFDTYPAAMSDLLPVDPFNTFYYPISITSLKVKLHSEQQSGTTYKGTLFLDNLRIVYPKKTLVSNETERSGIPDEIALEQNYPNPFNPTTQITFNIPAAGQVSLEVFDVLGRKVATIIKKKLSAGLHTYSFDASKLSSGLYLYRLKTENASLTRKMILLK